MEHKARKYCHLYKTNPSSAITCMYKELSQNIINGLSILLMDWYLYAAENSEAFIDFMIPIDWQQLSDFISELLSFESNDSLIVARVVRALKNQNATTATLMNLMQALRGCAKSVDVLVLLSVIHARMGKDKECLRYLFMISEDKHSIPLLRSRLYLLSVADLQLLKLTIESNRKTVDFGVKNKAYNREDSLEYVDGESSKSARLNSSKSATLDLRHSGNKAIASLRNSGPEIDETQGNAIFDEVAAALSLLIEVDIFLDTIIQAHLDAGRPYIALWLLLEHFDKDNQLPKLTSGTAKSLHEFILRIIEDFLEILKRENDRDSLSEQLGILRERAVKYCQLASHLDRTDQKTNILHLKCLYQNKQINDAISLAKRLLKSDDDHDEIIRTMSYCKLYLGEYNEATELINTISDDARGCVESICVRGFAFCLAGEVPEGINDIMSACNHDISTTMASFKSLKPSDQEKLRDLVTEHLRDIVATGRIDRTRSCLNENSTFSQSGNKALYCNEQLQDLVKLCEFLTSIYKKDLDIHLIYVEVLLKMNKYGDAQKILVLLVRRVPDDPLPMIHLANVRMRLGAYVAAVEDFRVIIRAIGCEKFSQNIVHLSYDDRNDIARVLRKHGFQHLQHQCYADAIECFDIAIIALGDVATGLVLVRAFSFANLGDYELALNDFKAVLEHEEENIAARTGSSVIYAVLGYEEESLENISLVMGDNRDTMVQVLQKLPFRCVMQFITTIENYIHNELESIAMNPSDSADELDEIGIYVEFLKDLHHKSSNFVSLQVQYLILSGDYDEALEAVNIGLKSAPNDPTLISKKGLVKVKMSKIKEALDVLRCIPVDNGDIIENDMKELTAEERDKLIEEAVSRADKLSNGSKYKEATELYNLAINMTENQDTDILRSRFMCLLNEGLVQQALGDITLVIETMPKCQDYCMRAKLLDGIGREKAACSDYIMALELDEATTVDFLKEDAILKHVLCMFCTASSSAFVREQYQEVLKYCDYGLKLDPNHKGMKQLRYRTKCIMNKCIVQ